MDKPRLLSIYWASIGAAALALGACDIDQTEEGNLPDPDVDVSLEEEGNLPEFDVEGPDVDIDTQERQIEVPDVDVDSETRTVPVPDVDVDLPEEEDAPAVDDEPADDEAAPLN